MKVYLKKMSKLGIEIPTNIIAYLVLLKFPSLMQNMGSQIMHAKKEMRIDVVLNHLV